MYFAKPFGAIIAGQSLASLIKLMYLADDSLAWSYHHWPNDRWHWLAARYGEVCFYSGADQFWFPRD